MTSEKRDPKIECLDTRSESITGKTIACKECGYINHDRHIFCYECKSMLHDKVNISLQYKVGNHRYTLEEMRFANDYARTNAKDLLQPTVWDPAKKKFVDNPDFFKEYGNPYSSGPELNEEENPDSFMEGSEDAQDPDLDSFISDLEKVADEKLAKLSGSQPNEKKEN